MITVVAFVGLAATGTLARTAAGRGLNRSFPTGTLVVNVTGSFALGLLAASSGPGVTVLGVGGLGAYTTFSSFARDAVALVDQRRPVAALAYVLGTTVLGVGAAVLAVALVS